VICPHQGRAFRCLLLDGLQRPPRTAPLLPCGSARSRRTAPTSQVRLHFSRSQHFAKHLSCVLDTAKLASPRDHRGVGVLTATAFPHLVQKPATATPPARAPARSSSCTTSRAALRQRLLMSTRPRPHALAPAHAASRAAAWSCQPPGAARTAPAPAPALRRAPASAPCPRPALAPRSSQPPAQRPGLARAAPGQPALCSARAAAPPLASRSPAQRLRSPACPLATGSRSGSPLPHRARSFGACRARAEPPMPAPAACPGQECPRAPLPEPAKETID
jgi:hypothetical protein